MSEHRYILEQYKGMNTRYRCPNCNKAKTFSKYIDTETGEHINSKVGRCNRESNCGYNYTPKRYFQENGIKEYSTGAPAKCSIVTPQPKPVSFISFQLFKASLISHETNHFVKFLIDLFGVEIAGQLVSRYFIATSKHWNGASVFWQIDTKGKVRTGKIMLYSPTTGKRVKEPFNHITWVHKAIKQDSFELKQCFFGEHLLEDKTRPVAIVESEKTAIIAGVYLPQFIWLAVGSLTNLNAEKCSILKGRSITLFPDLNGFEKWSNKAKELSHLAIFTVSDLLERKATEAERKQGLDLADYLIKFDYREFVTPEVKPTEQAQIVQPLVEVEDFKPIEPTYSKIERNRSENWEQSISELVYYFETVTLPTYQIKLNPYTTITNVSLFIESHFATIKANNGKRAFTPYLTRLTELKQLLTHNNRSSLTI